MKLYKNVDIIDLESILEKGILSMDACGNNNWEEKRRSRNATDVVYLFAPTGAQNSFVQYGAALVEVEIDDAKPDEMTERDVNRGLYKQYITDKVEPEQIKAVYVPILFKNWIESEILEKIESKITWCDMSAKVYKGDDLAEATEEDFAHLEHGSVESTSWWLYFRGVDKNENKVVDYYEINYKF